LSQRVQAVMVALFLLGVIGAVGVLLTRFDDDRDSGRSGASGSDLDPGEAGPTGDTVLVSGRSDLVVRIVTGSCRAAGGPKLELSKNQGRTFRQIRIPQVDDGSGVSASSPAVTAIAAARATSPLKIRVFAADTDCVVHEYSTDDGGGTWTEKPGTVKQWYKDPNTEDVAAPTGPVDSGCTDVDSVMPVTKRSAKVMCADGAIRSTTDGGATWTDVGKLPNASVAYFTGERTGYAAVAKPDCKSRIHVTIDGGATWSPRGCVVKDFVLPGLSGTDKRLVAGGRGGIRLSKDSGATWTAPTMK
jgi:hypothetical protein